jgi:acetyl-CoA carboxylase carboxyltransferase component
MGGWEQHTRNGVIDLAVDDDRACIDAVKQFLAFLPSSVHESPPDAPPRPPDPADLEGLRDLIPENRRRAYDVKRAIAGIVDEASFLELKPGFARNIVTGLARIDGRSVGIMANQPKVLAGTIDSDACRKVNRLIRLCDVYGLPILSLIDTPGILVGSAAEASAIVQHHADVMISLGQATVPVVSIVLRKGYGGGYVLMGGGRTCLADAALLWPQAEVIPMSVEGAVDVAFHKDYASAPDPAARKAEIIEAFYASASPLRAASGFAIDDIIDPVDTRRHVAAILRTTPGRRP